MKRSLRTSILSLAERRNGSFADALSDGWTYTQVLDEIARLQLAGLIDREGGYVALSPQGVEALAKLRRRTFPKARREVRLEPGRSIGLYIPPVTSLGPIMTAVSTADESRGGDKSSS